MTQFNDVIRAQAESARRTHLAEMEAARRVLATVDDTPYESLDDQVTRLVLASSRLRERLDTAHEGNRKLLTRATAAEEEVDRARRFSETTEKALRDQLTLVGHKVQIRAEAAAAAAADAQRAHAKVKRLKANVARLKAELDVAQGAPTTQLKSAGKQAPGGEQKSSRAVELSPDARTVRDAVARMRSSDSNLTPFTASQVRRHMGGALAPAPPAPSLHRIRKALAELEGVRFVKRIQVPRGQATQWRRRPLIHAAKKRTLR